MSVENKEIKRHFSFDYTELTAIAEYLEKQEEKGLRLKGIGKRKFIFEKAEPRKIRYSVEIFKPENAPSNEAHKEFVEACEKEGWEFVAFYHDDLYIFRTEKEDVIHIMTDDKEKLKIVSKRALLNPEFLWLLLCPLLSLGYLLIDTGYAIGYSDSLLCNPAAWLYMITLACLIFKPLIVLVDYLIWLIKAKVSLHNGEEVFYRNTEQKKKKTIIIFVITILFLLCLLLFASYLDSGYLMFENVSGDAVFGALTMRQCLYLLVFIILTAELLPITKTLFIKQQSEIKREVALLLTFIVCFAVCFGLYGLNERKAETVSKELLNRQEICDMFSDYDVACLLTERTRFMQYYCFGQELYPTFEVYVCNYPGVRQKFVDSFLEFCKEAGYETEAVITEGTWDVCHKRIKEKAVGSSGIAIKDNMIICVLWEQQNKNPDFFEVAYEKLSSEKGKGDVTQ